MGKMGKKKGQSKARDSFKDKGKSFVLGADRKPVDGSWPEVMIE